MRPKQGSNHASEGAMLRGPRHPAQSPHHHGRTVLMNKQTVDQMMNRLRLRHGIALRLIEALPEDKLNSNPIPNMRTPAQLIVHLYATVFREMIEGVQRGESKE